ncbi:hypothetical protein CHS0354_012912 [Potamilus streckersoni]|uniref:Uncharacterized protein n=1 Tax=Potamilus streckersoni TaxID=2493646 RepID=A0AAE0RNY9_9BIVA|nr:hypothetical protein CHS0354_012912 [Potamilus streckersoni]
MSWDNTERSRLFQDFLRVLGGEMDFDLVPVKATESLNTNAAKHRIAVRPKDRRGSSKRSMHRKGEKGEKQTPLPSLNEESPTKSYTDETQTDKSESKNNQNNDKLVTLIQVDPNIPGTSGVHSQSSAPIEIPRTSAGQDSETTRQRTPLSTSPISMSALQDVKLRSRPVPIKLDNIENRKDSSSEDVELSKKFEQVKRFSLKWENSGHAEVENVKSPSHDSMLPSVSLSSKDHLEEKKRFQIVVEEKKIVETVEKKEEKKEDKKTLVGSVEHPFPLSPTSPVTFVLKKEPLKPGAKVSEGRSDFQPKADSTDLSKSVKQVPEVSDSLKRQPAEIEKKPSREELGFKIGEKSLSKSDGSSSSNVPSSSPEKLASPREEYKARRQTRSKTLPEQNVPKELLDTAKTENTSPVHAKVDSTLSSLKQQKSVRHDYDNVIVGLKPVDVKRLSWVGISGSSVDSTTEPSWVALAKKKQADNDNKSDNVEPKDAKPMPIIPKSVSIVSTAPQKKDVKECQFLAEKKESSDAQTLVSGPRKDTSMGPLGTLPKKDIQSFTNKSLAVETKISNVISDSKKDINTSEPVGVKVPPKVVNEKSKSLERSVNFGSSVPQWKRDLSIKKRGNGTENASQVKIEIIEKVPQKVEKKEEEKTAVQIREKTSQEKFDLSSSNRKSKVLDMVKSFQKVS